MSSKQRTHKIEKLARIYDEEILPIWSQRFGRMVLRDLELPDRCQVLDVACSTGYPAVEIVRRLGPGSRLIALDASSAMIDVARRKVAEMGAKGVFFRTESAASRLSFADDVYDLVVCNLGLVDMPNPARSLADFTRVTVPGGQVRCTVPMEGTFQEFYDIYREVLTKHDKHETLARLAEHVENTYPTPAQCESWMREAGLEDGRVDVERFTLLFRSSREFFFAPVIEYGPLGRWKDIAGSGQEMQDVFWYIKEAIDAYFEGRAFAVTVVAGCLTGTKPSNVEEAATVNVARPPDMRPPTRPAPVAAPPPPEPDEPTGEDFMDLFGSDDLGERGDTDDELPTLDAFVEGKPRPDHLDE